MVEASYLRWLAKETATSWWHDSADASELQEALRHGATGATTNPVLAYRALAGNAGRLAAVRGLREGMTPAERAEAATRSLAVELAGMLAKRHGTTGGRMGYVCAQVDPGKAADTGAMVEQARRFGGWARNIAVKLPVTASGLEALEACAAEGITVTATISFTVSQAIAVAERYRKGLARARAAGKEAGRCFAVLMVGRLEDYLQDVKRDQKIEVGEEAIQLAGLAVAKRAYALYRERGYEAMLIVAALRGVRHVVELAGGELILSIHPRVQAKLLAPGLPREEGIGKPVGDGAIEELMRIGEFVRAYEPEGMREEEFITYGVTQRTLTQFNEAGWMAMGAL